MEAKEVVNRANTNAFSSVSRCVYTYPHTCLPACLPACLSVYLYVCIYVCVCVYVCFMRDNLTIRVSSPLVIFLRWISLPCTQFRPLCCLYVLHFLFRFVTRLSALCSSCMHTVFSFLCAFCCLFVYF